MLQSTFCPAGRRTAEYASLQPKTSATSAAASGSNASITAGAVRRSSALIALIAAPGGTIVR